MTLLLTFFATFVSFCRRQIREFEGIGQFNTHKPGSRPFFVKSILFLSGGTHIHAGNVRIEVLAKALRHALSLILNIHKKSLAIIFGISKNRDYF